MPPLSDHDREPIAPPWTVAQVKSLNAYQNCGAQHPYICGCTLCPEPGQGGNVPKATKSGWIRPNCGTNARMMMQEALRFTTDGSWRKRAKAFRKEQREWEKAHGHEHLDREEVLARLIKEQNDIDDIGALDDRWDLNDFNEMVGIG